ncbi:Benzyl alcohol O-benzoyltransferase [Bienertia sinuspersici]
MSQIIGHTKKPLDFNVIRRPLELITPASPTPYEFKQLSDIDDQAGFRFHIPGIAFYEAPGPATRGRDPVKVVKEAIVKALVPYYPLAGRIREKEGKKLVIECNGEGVMFIEAYANVTLEEFGVPLHPPFPCLDELICDVPEGIVSSVILCNY